MARLLNAGNGMIFWRTLFACLLESGAVLLLEDGCVLMLEA